MGCSLYPVGGCHALTRVSVGDLRRGVFWEDSHGMRHGANLVRAKPTALLCNSILNQHREVVERKQRQSVKFSKYQFSRRGWKVAAPLQHRKNINQRPGPPQLFLGQELGPRCHDTLHRAPQGAPPHGGMLVACRPAQRERSESAIARGAHHTRVGARRVRARLHRSAARPRGGCARRLAARAGAAELHSRRRRTGRSRRSRAVAP